jgi:glycosyltransferase involved in cell wall biosynthesis
MNILLSAFACMPGTGSETGVGWRWALELQKRHTVVLLTDESRREGIERALAQTPRPHLHVEYFRPRWLSGLKMNRWSAHLIYLGWQFSVLPFARKLHERWKFDLVHHLTYGVFRHPSFLGALGVPFVFGPVGGGEEAPPALRGSLPFRAKLGEWVRVVANRCARWDPSLAYALSKADLILAKTQDTLDALPARLRRTAVLAQEIGVDPPGSPATPMAARPAQPFRVLFAGRLLGWKGVHLVLRAFGQFSRTGVTCEVTVVGSGPMLPWLSNLAAVTCPPGSVRFVPHVPQERLLEMYGTAHCFLFPSLHDSSGNVVLEALSRGLPVICLGVGGPKEFVDATCGHVIDVSGRTEDEVIQQMADALHHLASNRDALDQLSRGALRRAHDLSWERQVRRALTLVEDRVPAFRGRLA